MALIQISYALLDDPELFDIICDSFDSVKEVRDEPMYGRKIIRVLNDEVPKEDIVICPELYCFVGIRPFIISYDV